MYLLVFFLAVFVCAIPAFPCGPDELPLWEAGVECCRTEQARTVMPDLDATVQRWPSLEICFFRDCDADRVIQLRFPVRAAVASDFSGSRASVLSPIQISILILNTLAQIKGGFLDLSSARSSQQNNTMTITTVSNRSMPFRAPVPPTMPEPATAVHSWFSRRAGVLPCLVRRICALR